MVPTNHSAAEIVSTNQHRVFTPCDHDDVKAPKYGHKSHVTPPKRWNRILGIVLKDRVEPGYEGTLKISPNPLAFPGSP